MKLLPVFLLLLLPICSGAQTDSVHVWNKWCARKDTLLLFRSGNNQIRVYCRGMKPSAFTVKSLDKSLRIGTPEVDGDTLSVLAMPFITKEKTMRLAIIDTRTSKVFKTVNFTQDSLPKPVARIGNLDMKEVARHTLLAQTKLRVVFPQSLYSYPYTVTAYTFKDSTAKGAVTLNVKTFFITNAVQKELAEVPENTEVTFTNIKALCPECATRTLPDLKVKVKP
jgi:hypothetical protein